jgi:hypothetical protein
MFKKFSYLRLAFKKMSIFSKERPQSPKLAIITLIPKTDVRTDADLFPAFPALPEHHRPVPVQGGEGEGQEGSGRRSAAENRKQFSAPQRIRSPGVRTSMGIRVVIFWKCFRKNREKKCNFESENITNSNIFKMPIL